MKLNIYRPVGEGAYNTWAIEITCENRSGNTIKQVLCVPKSRADTPEDAISVLVGHGF